MVEQAYIFKVGTVFTLLKDTLFYTETVKPSYFYGFIMSSQALIIPGVVLIMLYKLLLSNTIVRVVFSSAGVPAIGKRPPFLGSINSDM
jgi:hypothetical protein